MRKIAYGQASLEARFWAKVDKNGPLMEGMSTNCWIWTASKNPQGYGYFGVGGSKVRASHRVRWIMRHGKIPDGMLVCHECDNPNCVRLSHLFLGTNKDNSDDKIRKGRDSHLRGEGHRQAKLTDDQVAEMRQKYESGEFSQTALAKSYGITQNHASNIIHYRRRVAYKVVDRDGRK